jgi:prepilin-type N-terminal cleavage/methylation domain-containing protein
MVLPLSNLDFVGLLFSMLYKKYRDKERMVEKEGFNLIELMVVIAIIGFLSMIAVPKFTQFFAKAKRTEAYIHLHAIYAAETAYWAEHGTYSTQLCGKGGVGWQPEGYKGGGKQESFYYTYGFSGGGEGASYFTGKLCTSPSYLSGSRANDREFLAYAVGDICGNGKPDILAVDHHNNIVILQDALS